MMSITIKQRFHTQALELVEHTVLAYLIPKAKRVINFREFIILC